MPRRSAVVLAAASMSIGLLAGCGSQPEHSASSDLSKLASSVPSRPDMPTTPWHAPTPEGPKTSYVPPPPGFPSTPLPPPKINVPPGQPQPVATKYGITYTVPPDWTVSPSGSIGWDGPHGFVVGTLGEFGKNYCREDKGDFAQAFAGARGRNGVDIQTAAHEQAQDLEPLFTGDDGRKPQFEMHGPTQLQVSGKPAVRYTVDVGGLKQRAKCSPIEIQFDIVATQGYSNAEVMLFVVKRNVNPPNSVTAQVVDGIIKSLART